MFQCLQSYFSTKIMNDVLDDVCNSEDLLVFEKKYNSEVSKGDVSSTTQFEYACFLVKSKYPADISKGIVLLEELYKKKSGTGKRDYVFYLAFGNARLKVGVGTGKRDYVFYLAFGDERLKEYKIALKYVQGLLKVEPQNRQVLDLEAAIKKRMERDALKGAAIAGGVALLGVGAAIGLGIGLASRK